MEGSAAPKRPHRLTRETLRDGFVHEMIARSGTDLPVLSDAERHASLQATLAAQSAEIDMVSGATVTSQGYLQSLQSALDQVQA